LVPAVEAAGTRVTWYSAYSVAGEAALDHRGQAVQQIPSDIVNGMVQFLVGHLGRRWAHSRGR
jgi:hypothetical protein